MARSELFRTPKAERLGPLGMAEPPVHWFTESTRPEAEVGRTLVNRWYSDFDDSDGSLAARLRSENTVDHYQALDELLAYRLLRARSSDIRYEEGGQGPDFRMYLDDHLVGAVEVMSLFASDEWTAGQKHANRLIDDLNRRLGPPRGWFVGIDGDQADFPKRTVSGRLCADFIRVQIDSLNRDHRVQAEAGLLPVRRFLFDGGSIDFRFFPRRLDESNPSLEGRIVALGPTAGGAVNVGDRLRVRVAKKRYDLPESTPYLVFAVIHDAFGDDEDVQDALYGSRGIEVSTGKSVRDATFGLTVQNGRATPKNTRVSAVAAATRYLPWSIEKLDVAIFDNQYAATRWGTLLPCTRRFAANDGVFSWVDGDLVDSPVIHSSSLEF